MAITEDTILIAHALGLSRSLARQTAHVPPAALKDMAKDTEAAVALALEALQRVEGEADDGMVPLMMDGKAVGRVSKDAAMNIFAGTPAPWSIGG